MTQTFAVEFEFERETKGAVRYQETVAGLAEPKIGTLYVRKAALGALGITEIPTTLSVTVGVPVPTNA